MNAQPAFIVRCSASQPPLALSAPGELPGQIHGQPVRYFWKEMIRCGTYVHPQQKFVLEVTSERIDRWLANFRRMQAAGERVYAPVDHSTRAEDNRGYVLELRRQGDSLWGLHQLIGGDAIALASRCEVSVLIDPDYHDGYGSAYGEAIVHSSLVSDAVVPGQTGFVPIAAGRGQASVPCVFQLAASNQRKVKMPPEQLQQIREVLGAAELTEENAVQELMQTLLRERQQISLSASGGDPEALAALAEADEAGIQALVETGRITPAVGKKLSRALLRNADGKPNAMALSRGSGGAEIRLSRAVIEALRDNFPIELRQRTGGQVVPLGRAVPDSQPPTHDPQVTAQMAAMNRGR